MKRNVNPKEATNLLLAFISIEPEVKYALQTDCKELIIDWNNPSFAKLRLQCSSLWLLDEHHDPHLPICGVQSAELIRRINLPGVREDAYVLAGHHSQGQYYPGHFDSCTENLNHFLITQQCQISTADYHHNTSGWQTFRLPNDEIDPDEAKHFPSHKVAYKFVSKTHLGHYWEIYIIPIGFCFPLSDKNSCPIKNSAELSEYFNSRRQDLLALYTAAQQEQTSYFEDTYKDLLARNHQEFTHLSKACNQFNLRLADVRDHCPAYADLSEFSVQHDKLLYGNRLYTINQATRMVARIERQRGQYEKYQPKFEEHRQSITDTLYGEMDTNNPNYAEVTLPKSEFGPKESGYETKRFSYTDKGLGSLVYWVNNYT